MQHQQKAQRDLPDEVLEHLSNLKADYNHRIEPEHAEELLADDVRMKIRELMMDPLMRSEIPLMRSEIEKNGVPIDDQELETMELLELWEHLRQLRNLQGWGGPTLLNLFGA